jgi:phosphatidate cytidylyltransferase
MEIRLPTFDLNTFNTENFRLRLISAVILIPLVLWSVVSDGWIFTLILTLTVMLGLREWLRLIDPHLGIHILIFSYLSILITMLVAFWQTPALGLMIAALLALILFIMAARDKEETAGWIVAGIPYMGFSGLAMQYLRTTPNSGLGLICFLFAVVWGTDIGAYIVGRIVGGPKLAPDISPNKTWAGLIGGMVLAAIVGFAVALGFGAKKAGIGIPLAFFLAATAQAGDLFKSYFKRRAGVKESGGLIPGHGGVLDRIDGLVFAAIFMVFFQIALGEAIKWW